MHINYSYPLEAFAGHWRMVSQTNLDEVLEALGNNIYRLIYQFLNGYLKT